MREPMIPADAIQHLLCAARLRASVILLHGWAARAEVHLGDGAASRHGPDEATE